MTLFLCAIAFALGACFWALVQKHKPKPKLADPTNQHRYGHPWAPVDALRRKLPTAPTGHVWEISVATNDSGSSVLTLALVNVSTGENANSKTLDLTRDQYGRTWAGEYRKYSILSRSIFNNDLLGPTVDWAVALTNKVESCGQTTEYRMG